MLLDRVNKLLFLIVILGAVYLVFWPMYPRVRFELSSEALPSQIENVQELGSEIFGQNFERAEEYYSQNTLVIPKIGVESEIFSSKDAKVLKYGVWHRPNTGDPALGGNFVVAGHRFLYTSGKNTLYFLDRIIPGDVIEVFWEGEKYLYETEEVLEVRPDQLEIEQQTSQPLLTLYTCTPIYTSSKRLVVRAKLISGYRNETQD